MELKDSVVLVTGSSDGIGKETALLFAKEGANVVITYNSQKKKGEEVLKECKKLSECLLVHLDVSDSNSIKKCIEEVVDKFGAIDVLVNNAGIAVWKKLIEQSEDEIDKQLNVNVKGLIRITKEVLPYFKGQEEGIVVNIGSGAGKTGYGVIPVYCASKFAVRGFTQSMADEFYEGKIRFYCVNPGMTSTKMTNYHGVKPVRVAEVILNTAKEKLGKNSGEDVDVWDYI